MTPAHAPVDGARMRRALLLARRGWGQTAPNPMVGAVVVRDGKIIAEGWHARFGAPHAEAMALQRAGNAARGADVYVTLEPCAHVGKTPPCADALIAAGVRRVVIATRDPNPQAKGGVAKLREAGVIVEIGVEEDAARALNAPFLFTHTRHDRPFVTLKLALSAEGGMAPGDRRQQWLTGDTARRLVHTLRAGADAVMVGIGTVLADDPALTVRHGKRPRVAPKRVVLDRSARLPLSTQLARTARKIPVDVLALDPPPTRVEGLERAGVRVHRALNLDAHLQGLRERGVRHLFVEGGAAVAAALMGEGFVDRLIIFRAPVHLGAGALVPEIAVPANEGSDAWEVVERRMVGADQLTTYRPISR